MSRIPRRALLLSLAFLPALSMAQPVVVGQRLIVGPSVNPPGVETEVDLYSPANLIGQLTQATFGWSHGPCPAAVKIKFFRPAPPNGNPFTFFSFIAERGPFDVSQPTSTPPVVIQTVTLDPPVSVLPGDLIAITNLTQCGGPLFNSQFQGGIPPAPSSSFAVPGDATGEIQQPSTSTFSPGVLVVATGDVPGLLLLARFQITLDATDPRTGRVTTGTPNAISTTAGYFSLPEFTGDPTFPEVTVKMVDATRTALDGTFWFFHAPLTDVQYTLTVKDLTSGVSRTYASPSSSPPDQLCGGVDTSAFLP